MSSNILLINADAAGTETLKNLVLPGVGQFTIVDAHIIDANDAESNFFTPVSNIGCPRAQVIV